MFRPVSIYALSNGCTLLLMGAVTDVVGSRRMYMLGNVLQCAFTLATGLSKNGTNLIVVRGFCGAASSLCLPSAVSIVTAAFPPGPQRSVAFASMGGGLPIGFAIGLLLGGVCATNIGWNWAFYITSIINAVVLLLFVWQLPPTKQNTPKLEWRRLRTEIDWIGVLLISSSLAMLLYVLS
jgi:MFS family permease